jgi:hypothetical protein
MRATARNAASGLGAGLRQVRPAQREGSEAAGASTGGAGASLSLVAYP